MRKTTMSDVTYEKMLEVQTDLIRRQDHKIDELTDANNALRLTAQTLAEALVRELDREGRDRAFVPAKEIQRDDIRFRVEQTIGGDILLVRI